MKTTTQALEGIQGDALAVRMASALVLANQAALAHDTDPNDMRVAVSEEPSDDGPVWYVYYGPRDASYRMRGGDLMVYVDWDATVVLKVLYGQ